MHGCSVREKGRTADRSTQGAGTPLAQSHASSWWETLSSLAPPNASAEMWDLGRNLRARAKGLLRDTAHAKELTLRARQDVREVRGLRGERESTLWGLLSEGLVHSAGV